MISLIAALAITASPAPTAPDRIVSDDKAAGPAFTSQLRTLVVFKEGFGFYIRDGSAKLENGWATTNLVPSAIAGTFWVYPKDGSDRLDTIVLTPDNLIDFDKPEDLRTELSNKVGLQLAISTDSGAVEGKLTNLLDKMLLVQDEKQNFIAIEYAKIKSVTLKDYPIKIKLRTSKPDGVADIGIAYVQDGVRWSPTYTLELNGAKGRLTLRGTLLNLDERLKNANLVFVVGAPTLVNNGTIDDLLQGFVRGNPMAGAMGGGGFGGQAAGLAEARRAGGNGPGVEFKAADAKFVPIASDETGELQYYTKANFSLRPGERAMTTIFELEVPIHPLFDWNADGPTVEYILTMDNTSDQPFTTGPVFVVDGQHPVGQQVIPYTPPGSKAEIRLAQGVGMKVNRAETEISRESPVKIGEENYLPIKLQGTLTVENFRKDASEVRIHRTLLGKILDLGGGTVTNVDVSRNGPNTTNLVEWKVTVQPGKTAEVKYSYETYSDLGK